MKKVDENKTLAYAVAFLFSTSDAISFIMGKTMYRHINTVYDQRSDNEGFITIEIVYSYKSMKYEALNISDRKIGSKEITIL